MDMTEEFSLVGLDFDASRFDCLLDVAVGEDHWMQRLPHASHARE